ncbi:unnamed protein product [Gongylonema pulchrum]|uniref:Methyltransf_25 domain-containing protein n=1 Tax=Gongylonema pulchrum TaxID=637853 RepID=A0A183DUB7_9BILA|nr:unnamed protein product [Gongylonema pulchrum]
MMSLDVPHVSRSEFILHDVVIRDVYECCDSLFDIYEQRYAPEVYNNFYYEDMPLSVFRAALKKQFTINSHLSDLRIIDRKIAECRQVMLACQKAWYNEYHLRNVLFRENVEAKPKDFLSTFLHSKTYSSGLRIKKYDLIAAFQMLAELPRSIVTFQKGRCWMHRCLHLQSRNTRPRQGSVDECDIKHFAKLSPDWAKEVGSFKALYSMNRLRVPLIVDMIGRKDEFTQEPLSGLRIVDVGCGGGILTFPLARLGANVTALDPSDVVVCSAKETADRIGTGNPGLRDAAFQCISVEDFAVKNSGSKVQKLTFYQLLICRVTEVDIYS